ncbi:MAG: DUF429 domain-containing protein [Geodermatophilaceae bacterium]
MRAVLGVDGWPGGWLGVRVLGGGVLGDGVLGDGVLGDGVQWLLLADAAAVLAVDVPVVGIDIPVGLPGTGAAPATSRPARCWDRRAAACSSRPSAACSLPRRTPRPTRSAGR